MPSLLPPHEIIAIFRRVYRTSSAGSPVRVFVSLPVNFREKTGLEGAASGLGALLGTASNRGKKLLDYYTDASDELAWAALLEEVELQWC